MSNSMLDDSLCNVSIASGGVYAMLARETFAGAAPSSHGDHDCTSSKGISKFAAMKVAQGRNMCNYFLSYTYLP